MTIFIPNLSTQAGACLTMENWQEVGVDHIAYVLSALLIKPGLNVLKNYTNLQDYVGWSKQFVLNASTLKVDKRGLCQIRSHFDGACLKFDFRDLIALIAQWAPHYLLLPKQFPIELLALLTQLPQHTNILVCAKTPICWENYPHFGVYFDQSEFDLESASTSLQAWDGRIKYMLGSCDIASYKKMSALGITHLESDTPAQDALQGLVYTSREDISVADLTQHMNFDVIDKDCSCPTCQQGLSLAYLTHLYAHTPLLCHRFLIQHNVFQACHLP